LEPYKSGEDLLPLEAGCGAFLGVEAPQTQWHVALATGAWWAGEARQLPHVFSAPVWFAPNGV
jgi:hypothetical protein